MTVHRSILGRMASRSFASDLGGLVLVAIVVVVGCGSPPSESASATASVPSVTPIQSPAPSAAPAASFLPAPSPTPEPLWVDVTADAIGTTGEWTNKVEIADVDGDTRPDLLFANGGDYEQPGEPEPLRVFVNEGGGRFREATEDVFGPTRFLSRVVKVADVDADGIADIIVGATYQTQTRLYRGRGDGAYEDVTEAALPAVELSVGDLEIGDVDGDRDLDVVLADWGGGNPMGNDGGRTRLWLNDGAGRFQDATEDAMPDVLVRFSWELELLDIDADWDLDVAVSCKRCAGSFLFENDGSGRFIDVSAGRMPQFTNNYEFEPMDLDGDGDLDLVTINDGPDTGRGLAEHVFRNDAGTFVDATAEWWFGEANPGYDDNQVVFLDADSDGDPDFLVGSLDGPDRLVLNDGTGHLSPRAGVFGRATASGGTLGLAVADLDGDGRLDVVEGQGEVPGSEDERVYLGRGIAPDTAPPSVAVGPIDVAAGGFTIRARIHDRKSPSRPFDWKALVARWSIGESSGEDRLVWYGEYLWQVTVPAPSGAGTVEICAADASGNETCSSPAGVTVP